jgi:hypothetical protein
MKTKFNDFLDENLRQDKIKDLYKNEIKHLNVKLKSKINKDINEYLKPIYFSEIPLDDLFKILEKYDIVPVQEDGTYWEGLLLGEQGNTIIEIANKMSSFIKNDITFYTPFENAGLSISWYKMGNGKWEIVSYIS